MTSLDLSLDNFLGAGVATDTDIAIAQTRSVFESVPGADAVLSYLEATLAAGAEVRASDEWRERALKAEAQLAGGVNASIGEGSHASAGEGLVAGAAADVLASVKGFVEEVNAAPVPLVELSREAFSLSNKIQQPVELTVQLLMLAELRKMAKRLVHVDSASLGPLAV